MWGANGAKGIHSGYKFENLFLDNWYSLAQMEQEYPGLQGFTFRNIWALDQPPLADSTMTGDVADVTFDNVKYGQKRAATNADLPLVTGDSAQPAHFPAPHEPVAAFTVDPPVFAPGENVTFTAQPSLRRALHMALRRRHASHAAAACTIAFRTPREPSWMEEKTALAASGFCSTLEDQRTEMRTGRRKEWWPWPTGTRPTSVTGPTVTGLTWQIYPGEWTELPNLAAERAVFAGESPNLHADSQGFTHYAAAWDGFIDIPADGGYTFHLLARDGARLVIDGVEVAKTGPPLRRFAARRATRCATIAARWACAPANTCFTWKDCTRPARARPACCGKAPRCR